MGKLFAVVRWVGALAVAAIVAVGVPYFLWRAVGNPMPDAGTTPRSIWDMLFTSQSVEDNTVIKAAGVIGWVAWLHIMYVAVREAFSSARRTVPPAIRSGSLTQRFVRPVISTLFWLGGASSSIVTMAPVAGAAPVGMEEVVPLSQRLTVAASSGTLAYVGEEGTGSDSVTMVVEFDEDGEIATVEDEVPQTGLRDGSVLYQVNEGDFLWDLAERHLGDGMRWHEIYDLSTGYEQVDGQSFVDEDLIRPDWLLQLPADAVGVPEPDAGLVEQVFGIVAEVGQEAAEVAEEIAVPEEVEANDLDVEVEDEDVVADDDGDVAVDDAGLASGESAAGVGSPGVSLPSVVVTPVDETDVDAEPEFSEPVAEFTEEPILEEVDAELTQPGGVEPTVPASVPVPLSTDEDSGDVVERTDGVGIPVVPAAGLLLATAALGYFGLSRRRAKKNRPVGKVHRFDANAAAMEQGLTEGADENLKDWLFAAFDSVNTRAYDGEGFVPAPSFFTMPNPEELEVAFMAGENSNVPAPWVDAEGSGKVWVLDRDVSLGSLAPVQPSDWLTPAIVTAGTGVWFNLEWFGVVSLQGNEEMVAGWLRHVLSELRMGAIGEDLEFWISEGVTDRHGVLVSDVKTNEASIFENAALSDFMAFYDDGGFDAYTHRLVETSQGGDRFYPTIVVVHESETGELTELLAYAETRRLPLVVMVAGKYETEHSLYFENGTMRHSNGLVWDAVFLSEIAVGDIGQVHEVVQEYQDPEDEASERATAIELGLLSSTAPAVIGSAGASEDQAAMRDEMGAALEEMQTAVDDVESDDGGEPMEDLEPEAVASDEEDIEASADDVGQVDYGESVEDEDDGIEPIEASDDDVEDDEVAVEADDSAVLDLRDESAEETKEGPMVRVLGAVSIDGFEGSVNGSALALACYLVLIGDSNYERLFSALFPSDEDMEDARARKRISNLVGSLRSSLGSNYVPASSGGSYSLRGVRCDLLMAMDGINEARSLEDGPEAIAVLSDVLDLVTDRPFMVVGVQSPCFDWFADHDLGLMSSIEVNISEAALRLSKMLREDGDFVAAREVCEKGRMVNPYWVHLAIEHVEVLLGTGQRAQALKLVSAWESQDEAMTGRDPSPELRQAYEALVESVADTAVG